MANPINNGPVDTATPVVVPIELYNNTIAHSTDILERTNMVMEEGLNKFERYQEKAQALLPEMDYLLNNNARQKRIIQILEATAVVAAITVIAISALALSATPAGAIAGMTIGTIALCVVAGIALYQQFNPVKFKPNVAQSAAVPINEPIPPLARSNATESTT